MVLRFPVAIKKVHFPSIGSTNAWARDNVASLDASCLTVVTADHQTAGKGQGEGRVWHDAEGMSILATYCFRVPAGTRDLPCLTAVMALSASQVCNLLSVVDIVDVLDFLSLIRQLVP